MKFNWPLVGTFSAFWGCVWFYGFFQTMTWSIVITAVIALWLRLSGRA